MSEFVIRATGEVLSPLELQARYPNTSNPQALPEVAHVESVDPPQFDGLVERDGIEKVRGAWRQKWTTRPYTPQELQSQHDTQRAQLVKLATALRWERMTGGIAIGGVMVGTTIEDQDSINRVLSRASDGGITTINFKAASGWVRGMPLEALRQIAGAIARHVDACYTAEMEHHDAIAALNDSDLASYDVTTGWPA